MAFERTSEFPGFDNFFALTNAWKRGSMRFRISQPHTSPDRLLLGLDQPSAPVLFDHDSGSSLADLMGETHGVLSILSPKAVQVLQSSGATGFLTFAVVLRLPDGGTCSDYRVLAVTGRAGPLDRTRCRFVTQSPAAAGGEATTAELGAYFDERSWDGCDIFVPESSAIVCVTRRVRDALETAKLRNLSFVALRDYTMMLHSSVH